MLYAPQPPASRLKIAVGIAVLVAAVAVVLLSGVQAITPENITAHLNRFSSFMTGFAAEKGKEGKFSYDGVEIEGWGYNKQALVKNVSLELAEKSLLDTTKWSLSTTSMRVLPDQAMGKQLFFQFPEPINIIENSQLRTVITTSSPIKYGFLERREDGQKIELHTLYLPEQITFTPGAPAGEPVDKGAHVIVTYDPSPEIYAKVLPDSHTREVSYKFSNIKMLSGNGPALTLAGLAGRYHEAVQEDGLVTGNYGWTLDGLSLRDGQTVTHPYNISVALTYHGEPMRLDLKNMLPGMGNNAETTLDELLFASDNFKLSARGKFSTADNDPLPFGNVSVDVENAGNFIASDLVPATMRSAVAAVLQKISGKSVDPGSHIVIPLKREKGGVFYVGDVTFEQLTASLLKDALKASTQRPLTLPPPQEPSEDEPAEKDPKVVLPLGGNSEAEPPAAPVPSQPAM